MAKPPKRVEKPRTSAVDAVLTSAVRGEQAAKKLSKADIKAARLGRIV